MADIDSLKQALTFFPRNVPLLLMLAEAHLDQFSFDDARSAFELALSVEPNNPQAKVQLVRLLDLEGKGSEAILRLEKICNEIPNYAPAWILRASLSLNEGRVQDAREFYERAIRLDASVKNDSLFQRIRQAGGVVASDSGRGILPDRGGGFAHATFDDLIFEEDEEDSYYDDEDDKFEFPKNPEIDFRKVGGMDAIKEALRLKIVYPLKNREIFEVYGKKAGGGILLYGPPGCGKTLVSLATASEIDAKFFNVGPHLVLDMWIGKSEEKIHELFEMARKQAPAVLFFDEVEAFATDRREIRSPAGRSLINQFLIECDHELGRNDGVLVIGATSAPWHLDSAFLRPGRFDQGVFVPPPCESDRIAIIRILAEGKPFSEIDPAELARRTEGFSGADLKAVFDKAIEGAISETIHTGKVIPVSQRDLLSAVDRLRPSVSDWFEQARTQALYSEKNGFYDAALQYLKCRDEK